ncbi:hypothetical protein BGZ95_008684 [Linnemannia exigua]|uniref:AB hydrolase-1 domain-containing protein n=1 Tax=Linnemannia exigua TaxID=604196 RepID=A0AAD4DKU0_9FUNG|nr:hypothetical protein BGZ95_008684 [Linnemannia exigua]
MACMACISNSLLFFFLFTLLSTPLPTLSEAANPTKKIVNIVLVHSAIANGSSWYSVIPHLQAAGHTILAVQQHLSSIDDVVARVKIALATFKSGPIVLVSHSFGGLVFTQTSHGNNNIPSLVYIAAFAPDQGESIVELSKGYQVLPSSQNFIPDGAGQLTLSQDNFLKYFAPDVDEKQAKIMTAAQGPCDVARSS